MASYPSREVPIQSANATISRTILYDPTEDIEYVGGVASLPWDTQLEAFLYPFWLGTGVAPGVPYDCPTSNCSYDPFRTVAADFQCTTLPSTLLEFGCKNTSAEWLSTVAYGGPGANPNVTSCGYYLNVPNNLPQLMSGYEIEADNTIGEILATRFLALSDVFTNERFFDGSISYGNIKNPIVDFIVVSTPSNFEGAAANRTPIIRECEVHWVVQELEAKVSNNLLSESIIETMEFPSDLNNPWDPNDSDSYLANFALTLPDVHSLTGANSTYGMDNTTARKVWQVWTEIAPSTYTRPSSKNPVQSGDVLKMNWLSSRPTLLQVFDSTLPWDASSNITAHMADAIHVMNQVVRRNTISQRHRHDVAVGHAFQYVVMVQVNWPWVAFPVALLFTGLIFLLLTVWQSSKNKQEIGVWKGSALPALFRGPTSGHEELNLGGGELGHARTAARKMKVRLSGGLFGIR